MKPSWTMGTDSLQRLVPVAGKSSGGTGFPRFRKMIEETTYKPGYELELRVHDVHLIDGMPILPVPGLNHSHAMLQLTCYVPDSTRFPHDLTKVQSITAIPDYIEELPEPAQRHFLREIFLNFEQHEIDEWFRINGKLVHDPHG